MTSAAAGPPSYQFSLSFMARWLFGVVLRRRRRSLAADASALFGGRRPRPLVVGIDIAEHQHLVAGVLPGID